MPSGVVSLFGVHVPCVRPSIHDRPSRSRRARQCPACRGCAGRGRPRSRRQRRPGRSDGSARSSSWGIRCQKTIASNSTPPSSAVRRRPACLAQARPGPVLPTAAAGSAPAGPSTVTASGQLFSSLILFLCLSSSLGLPLSPAPVPPRLARSRFPSPSSARPANFTNQRSAIRRKAGPLPRDLRHARSGRTPAAWPPAPASGCPPPRCPAARP